MKDGDLQVRKSEVRKIHNGKAPGKHPGKAQAQKNCTSTVPKGKMAIIETDKENATINKAKKQNGTLITESSRN
jgi:hypothetical protein